MKKYILTIILLITFISIFAQKDRNNTLLKAALNGIEYEIKAGWNIGGTTPIPLPEEIRSIDGYNPTLSLTLQGNMTKWFGQSKKWGISTGLRLENKGMITKATVKNYSMKIIGNGGEEISGYWTGGVKTKVENSCLTVPLLAAYKISPRWDIKVGPYISYLINGDFSGHVYEGYLREDDPTGPKREFTDGKIANYDFSNELRRMQYGMQIGGSWKAFSHFNIYGEFTFGMNDIFRSSFNTISFNMYPIFLNLGFGYAF